MRPSLVFFATQGFHQLGVVQSGAEGDRGDGDEHSRLGASSMKAQCPFSTVLATAWLNHAVAQALRKYSTVCTGCRASSGSPGPPSCKMPLVMGSGSMPVSS